MEMIMMVLMTNKILFVFYRLKLEMQQIIAAGILYLLGVALILVLKPTLMFTEDGSWKEFGIGRNRNTHTWMPFWFFSIIWALISYIIVSLVFSVYYVPKIQESPQMQQMQQMQQQQIEKPKISSKSKRAKGVPMNLPDGYYIMNTHATEEAGGIPKYIYIGKGLPEDTS